MTYCETIMLLGLPGLTPFSPLLWWVKQTVSTESASPWGGANQWAKRRYSTVIWKAGEKSLVLYHQDLKQFFSTMVESIVRFLGCYDYLLLGYETAAVKRIGARNQNKRKRRARDHSK